MCFSATASFTAGIILSGIGIATIKKTKARSQLLLASIPLIFSVQQISEGVLWLAMTKPAYAGLQDVATYTFLFFAQILWPVYVPYAILKLDKKNNWNLSQKILTGLGAMVSLYLAYCMLNFENKAQIIGYHIKYQQDYPQSLAIFSGAFYVISTIAPSFLSGYKRMWIFGATVLISYIITAIFYTDYIVSVWCFFSAIVSISIYAILHYEKKAGIASEREFQISQ